VTKLAQYQNGNCLVRLHSDGTKFREWDGIPNPVFPESIDLKITDYCDAGCTWCHEKSTVRGVHGDALKMLNLVNQLPAGVELAIGGGNPLDLPGLDDFLHEIGACGLIPNLTVNGVHIRNLNWKTRGLVYGLGISWVKGKEYEILDKWDDRTVLHVIAGVHNPLDILNFSPEKLLILGYKDFGFGKKHNPEMIRANIWKWRYFMSALCQRVNIVAFDNLALDQLHVREMVTKQVWKNRFMGQDGEFTMYIDGVKEEFAATSTSQRHPIGNLSIKEMFAQVRNNVSR